MKNVDIKFIINLFIVIIATIASIWVSFYVKDKRRISYKLEYLQYLSLKNEVVISNELPIEIRVNGQIVDRATIANLSLINTGNSSINEDDFRQDLRIKFSGESKIKFANITTIPNNIDVNYKFSEKEIQIKPVLLNQEDKINIMLISDGYIGNPIFEYRVRGIGEILEYEQITKWFYLFYARFIISIGFIGISILAGNHLISFVTRRKINGIFGNLLNLFILVVYASAMGIFVWSISEVYLIERSNLAIISMLLLSLTSIIKGMYIFKMEKLA